MSYYTNDIDTLPPVDLAEYAAAFKFRGHGHYGIWDHAVLQSLDVTCHCGGCYHYAACH